MSNFSQNIKALRLKRNMSQAQLSRIAGVSRQMINLYEAGKREPIRPDIRERLCSALNCSESDLFGYSDGAASSMVYAAAALDSAVTTETPDTAPMYGGEGFWWIPPTIKKNYPNGNFIYGAADKTLHGDLASAHIFFAPCNINLTNGHLCALEYHDRLYLRKVNKAGNSLVLEAWNNPREAKVFIDLDREQIKLIGVARYASMEL